MLGSAAASSGMYDRDLAVVDGREVAMDAARISTSGDRGIGRSTAPTGLRSRSMDAPLPEVTGAE